MRTIANWNISLNTERHSLFREELNETKQKLQSDPLPLVWADWTHSACRPSLTTANETLLSPNISSCCQPRKRDGSPSAFSSLEWPRLKYSLGGAFTTVCTAEHVSSGGETMQSLASGCCEEQDFFIMWESQLGDYGYQSVCERLTPTD